MNSSSAPSNPIESLVVPKISEKDDLLMLRGHVDTYLERVREAVTARFHDYKPEYEARRGRIVKAADAFDDLVKGGIGDRKVIMTPDADTMLKEINKGTRLVDGVSFTDVLGQYYASLQETLETVVSRLKRGGGFYLMDGLYGCREEAMADIEKLLRKLEEAGQVNKHSLVPRSEIYRVIESRPPHSIANDAVERESNRINTSLVRLAEGIGGGHRDEQKVDALLTVTSDLLRHLEKNLGKDGLQVIGTEGDRPLKHLEGGPLHQMEAALSILNRIIRDHENLVAVHRDIIGGIDRRSIVPASTEDHAVSA